MPNPNLDTPNTLNEDLIKAVKAGDEAKVRLHIQFIDFNFFAENDKEKTLLQIAKDENQEKIVKMITDAQKKQIQALEEKTKKVREVHSYENYCITLRKSPSDKLYAQYLLEIFLIRNSYKKYTGMITKLDQDDVHSYTTPIEIIEGSPKSEEEIVKSRKLWSDVVSKTYFSNQEQINGKPNLHSANQEQTSKKGKENQAKEEPTNLIKEKVIERLTELNFENPEKIYELCLEYIRDHSVITVTYQSSFLKNGLISDFQLLNMWERDNRNKPAYTANREETELALFSYLPDDVEEELTDDKHARPRYSALLLLDSQVNIRSTLWYGKSFIVLSDVIKNNSLFVPGDSLTHKNQANHDYKPCTIHNFEFLLWQCPLGTLEAIATRVLTGHFSNANYNQNRFSETDGGYIETLIPAVNIFDKYSVNHIHVSKNGCELKKEDIEAIENVGITVSNEKESPFPALTKQAILYIAQNNIRELKALIKKQPLILKTFDEKGLSLMHVAAEYGKIEILKLFKKYGLKNNSFIGGRSPLQIACEYNQLEAVKYLVTELRNGPGIVKANYLDETINGWTALHLASRNGHSEIVRYLIEQGADVTIRSPNREYVINYATKLCDIKTMAMILKRLDTTFLSKNNNPLYIASSSGDFDKVKLLLTQYKKLTRDEKFFFMLKRARKKAVDNGHHAIAKYIDSECLLLELLPKKNSNNNSDLAFFSHHDKRSSGLSYEIIPKINATNKTN